jgi:hypothetical protein
LAICRKHDDSVFLYAFNLISLSGGDLGDSRNQTLLGSVGIQDSHPGLVVIQAVDGPIRFD